MNTLQSVIARHTRGLSVIEIDYSEELPNPDVIAKELGAEGVALVFEEVANISAERERLDREGEVNCDTLDDYWRAATRMASVIPYQARTFPESVLHGLASESRAVRFYCAYSISKVPFRGALLDLKAALARETDQLNIQVIGDAVKACSSFTKCMKEKIAKLKGSRVVWCDA
ncbi:hypothetical protein [Rhodoferax mekongensis]|uniref:hypothetical protein n=1 Tax=Rhodoferax mekongensis TaxID=3068341 RepID=UPI0028BF537D|nr:hypothetical protein [Rhodoferax sp. TBRC 17199]MDT7514832.1 hypothetical protein [Rhodoferax sp. TBRC 17199]